jgi:KinB signaling pathway activation protein
VGIKNWSKFFLINSLLGILASTIVGTLFELVVKENNADFGKILIVILTYALIGFTISVLSHMGYFFYQYLVGSLLIILGNKKYNIFLLLLIAISMIYITKFSLDFSKQNDILIQNVISYLILIFIVIIVVGLYKVKLTNKSALIPSLCYLIFATLIEGSVSFGSGSSFWIVIVISVLIITNSYQLLFISNFLKKGK